jgi:uncharacterized protein (TIGR03083 family)
MRAARILVGNGRSWQMLGRQVVVPGLTEEYETFADLIQGLSEADLQAPTRCEGWTVSDVAGHVIGQLTDVVNLRLEGLGTPEVTEKQAEERRGRSPAELAKELSSSIETAKALLSAFDDESWDGPAPPGANGKLGFGVEALWFDTYLHRDDILSAVGRPGVGSEGMLASLSHVTQVLTDSGWDPCTFSFEAYGDFPVSGGGRKIERDPMEFLLAATGRSDPAGIDLDRSVNIYA